MIQQSSETVSAPEYWRNSHYDPSEKERVVVVLHSNTVDVLGKRAKAYSANLDE